jgi:antitoxin ParD1/3/4
MHVNLGKTLDRLVSNMVKSGMYQSQSHVLRESLRLLKERKQWQRTRLNELRSEIAIGDDAAVRGKLLDGPAVFARIRRKSAARKRTLSRR